MQSRNDPRIARAAKIHIGKHKTGTTSFQYFLERQRERLAGSGVFVVPGNEALLISAAVIRDDMPIPPVVDFLRKGIDFSPEAVRRGLHARLSEAPVFHTVLLSCEHLSYFRTQTEIDAFGEIMAEVFNTSRDRMNVAVVLRDRDDFLASYRAQISASGPGPVADPRSPYYCDPDSWLVDDARLVRLWTENAASTTILDYRPEGMVGALTGALGLPLEDEAREVHLNRRPDRVRILKRRVLRAARRALRWRR